MRNVPALYILREREGEREGERERERDGGRGREREREREREGEREREREEEGKGRSEWERERERGGEIYSHRTTASLLNSSCLVYGVGFKARVQPGTLAPLAAPASTVGSHTTWTSVQIKCTVYIYYILRGLIKGTASIVFCIVNFKVRLAHAAPWWKLASDATLLERSASTINSF